jgi:hypothetical protein
MKMKSEFIGQYVIVRTYSAGVFAGQLTSLNGQEAVIENARRLWYWSGAASLSQLSVDGVANPSGCKFPVEVKKVFLTQVIEILPVTEKAKKSINDVPVWKK